MDMKKYITIIAVVVALATTHVSGAQERPWIGHLAVGFTAGGEGLGINLATPLGDRFQLRAGYSMTPRLQATFSNYVSIDEPWSIHGPVTLSGSYQTKGPTLFLDFFPAPWSSRTHLTLGLVATDGRRVLRGWTPDPLPIDSEDMGTSGFTVADGTVTTDPEGRAEGFVDVMTLKPYLGFGAGRECCRDSRLSLTVDVGLVWFGKPRAYSFDWTAHAYGGAPKEVEVTSADLANLDSPFFDFTDDGVIDIARKLRAAPLVRIGLYVKLF